jgi:beta-N-acetylhexosaminidase
MKPAGIILFARNVVSPDQVKQLVAEARMAAASERFLVLVDQEGGRVQRLSAPHWPRYPKAQAFARIADEGRAEECARLCARLIADDLHELGINTSCAPVLDVPVAGADDIIGDRAYGNDPATVIRLGGAVARGLLEGGVLPVMKHIPGHGRAMADSHLSLPVIEAPLSELQQADFTTFAALRHLPMAMTAHVVLTAVDPTAPVTISKKAIDEIVRGFIGFDGLLMTDDLSMKALSGSIGSRTRAALEAGCDIVLHCNGKMAEMAEVAAASPLLEGESRRRFEAAWAHLSEPAPFDRGEAKQALADSLAALA